MDAYEQIRKAEDSINYKCSATTNTLKKLLKKNSIRCNHCSKAKYVVDYGGNLWCSKCQLFIT